MQIQGAVVAVTGGGGGIGAGMCRGFAAAGARAVAVADIDEAAAQAVADEISAPGGTTAFGMRVDVGVEAEVRAFVQRAEEELGGLDLFCANAGIMVAGGIDVADDDWDRIWRVNVKSHIYAARAVLPGMTARGGGYLLHTASAAGLLTQLGAAPYAVTKHAVVALAEWIAITYADAGIKVSCLCPQAVETAMTGPLGKMERPTAKGSAAGDGVLQPADVAAVVLDGLAEERFLILPHPQVATYEKRRADDRDRWLRGMQRAQAAMADDLRRAGRA
jgi:NAD(P)-dependent dehydrogenase (short-subunit alcohol dehydrogenase family)